MTTLRLRALVAVGNPVERLLLGRLLAEHDLQVDAGGPEALASLPDLATYDVVVLDLPDAPLGVLGPWVVGLASDPTREAGGDVDAVLASPVGSRGLRDALAGAPFVQAPAEDPPAVAAGAAPAEPGDQGEPVDRVEQGDQVQAPVLDQVRLTELADQIGLAGVVEIVRTYLGSLDERWGQLELVDEVRRGVGGAEGAGALQRAAHSLKSSSALVGAEALRAWCADLEALLRSAGESAEVRSGRLPTPEARLREATRSALEAWLQGVQD